MFEFVGRWVCVWSTLDLSSFHYAITAQKGDDGVCMCGTHPHTTGTHELMSNVLWDAMANGYDDRNSSNWLILLANIPPLLLLLPCCLYCCCFGHSVDIVDACTKLRVYRDWVKWCAVATFPRLFMRKVHSTDRNLASVLHLVCVAKLLADSNTHTHFFLLRLSFLYL